MALIGLLSDTHGYFDPKLTGFFKDCIEIWHAGDIGNLQTAVEISDFKPLRAVYGNIDGTDIRSKYPEDQRFEFEGTKIWIRHIGGYPGHYPSGLKNQLKIFSPDIYITGHSHICKVMRDKELGLLHINPGAAGKTGFHPIRTAVRFRIESGRIYDLEVIELGTR